MDNELIIKAGGKSYRATFSRPLTTDERRRIAGLSFAGTVCGPEDAQKVVEAALGMLKVQDEALLTVLNMQELR